MSTASVLSVHPGPYTLSDLEAMPDDGQRYELIDGGLWVTPAPTPLHQRVARRLSGLLTSAGRPAGLETVDSIDVDCGGGTVLQPDAVVLPATSVDAGPRVIAADLVALVAEIVSPSTVRIDRVLKAQVYAEAGIPHYLLVELDRPSVTWFALSSMGGYAVRAAAADDEVLCLTEPVAAEIAPSALLRPWD
jgi:Uma2 family endonuclease